MKKKILFIVCLILTISILLGSVGCSESNDETSLDIDTGESDSSLESNIDSEDNGSLEIDSSESNAESESNVDSESVAESESNTESEIISESNVVSESNTASETDKQTEEEQTQTETEKIIETGKKMDMPMTPGQTKTDEILTEKVYDFSKLSNCFRFVGRVKNTSTGLIFDHAASAIEFQGFMTGDVVLMVTSNKESYFTVYIDGVRSETRFMVSGTKLLTVASFEGNYFHTVRIVRQSEVAWSQSLIRNLRITGYLYEAPEDRPLYLEFYGDSLTSAFGNIGSPSDPAPHDVPKYQDATQSYAYLTTEALGADCSILAMSGVGLATGHYDRHFLHYFSQFCHKRGNSPFEFENARVPDIAVVRLGANDFSVGCTREQYVSRAKELIDYIRNGYKKDVPIIWMYGSRGGDFNSWLKELSDFYGGEEGGFYLLELGWRDHGVGAGGHPSVASHEANAETLLKFIEDKKILK